MKYVIGGIAAIAIIAVLAVAVYTVPRSGPDEHAGWEAVIVGGPDGKDQRVEIPEG
jgi:hypothetical protein